MLWTRPLTTDGGGVCTDASGTVYLSTRKGFDVLTPGGAFVRSVDIYGTGSGQDVCVAPNGTVYVVDIEKHRIQRYSKKGKALGRWGSKGITKGHFQWPHSIAADAKSDIYVADSTGRIQKFTSTGRYVRTIGGRGKAAGQFRVAPNAIAIDASGTLFAIEAAFEDGDPSPDRVQKFSSTTGKYQSRWKASIGGNDIAIDRSGNVFVGPYDEKAHVDCVRRFSRNGTLRQTYLGAAAAGSDDSGGAPWSIAVDGFGSFLAVCYGAG